MTKETLAFKMLAIPMTGQLESLVADPNVIAALIAACVSIVVAGFSGIYVLIRSNQRIKILRDEMLEKHRVERFVTESTRYRERYRAFKEKLAEINGDNIRLGASADGTEMLQHTLNFFGVAKSYYMDNNKILGNESITEKLDTVQILIDSGTLNDRSNAIRSKNLKSAFETSIAVIDDIYQASLR